MSEPGNPKDSASAPIFLNKKNVRNFVVLLLKIGIASALLYWLVSSGRLEFSHLRNISWSPRTLGLVMLGVAAVWAGLLLLSLRLCLMVRSGGIELSLRRAFSLTSIGAFSGSILPGVVGGDVVKVVYLCRGEASTQRTFATTAIMCDRAVGLFSLFLLGSIVLIQSWAIGSLPFWSPILLIAPFGVLSAMIAVTILSRKRFPETFSLGNRGRNLASRIHMAVCVADHFVHRPFLLAGCIGLSLANHILVCCTFLIAAELLGGIEISSLQQFLLNPIAMVMNIVPITPGGVGVTESAFSYLYFAAGCSIGATIGILGRTIQYIAFIFVGFPAFIFRGK
ncbi:MAG: flippase-like domain-containing protein [Candidatus Krumholzibacteria bacterium]|nr:flippase-like domain-containing protein [Candidatus Krumholzibacteria bacterium]